MDLLAVDDDNVLLALQTDVPVAAPIVTEHHRMVRFVLGAERRKLSSPSHGIARCREQTIKSRPLLAIERDGEPTPLAHHRRDPASIFEVNGNGVCRG